MNMERTIIPQNDPQQLPFSPKKKLHTKEKGSSLADTITNARASLKDGKDISARNLMECSLRKPLVRTPSFAFDPTLANETSESTVDEIVVLDEEHTDFLSTRGGFNDEGDDDDDSIVEEIVEEYYEEEFVEEIDDDDDDDYTDDSLEPLPPPIVIPKSLRVRDSDDEDNDDDDDDDDDDDIGTYENSGDDDDDDSLPSIKQQQKLKTVATTTKRDDQSSTTTQLKNKITTMKSDAPVDVKKENKSTVTTSPEVAVSSTKAAANGSGSNQLPPETIGFKGAPSIQTENDDTSNETDDEKGPVWEKPDWTKNNRLKATGVSAAGNLAKPITQLPELVSKNDMNDIKTPRKSNTMQAKLVLDVAEASSMMQYPKSPVRTPKVNVDSKINAPKSAPQMDGGRKKITIPTAKTTTMTKDDTSNDNDDEFTSKIAWEKPEWAIKKVLRATSKTETILSGGKLERPIGGIRPID